MKYQGSCHCGKITFEMEGEIEGAVACNCSICQRKGWLLWFVPMDKFKLKTSPEDMGTYTFNRHVIKHHFCKTCGISPYSEGSDPAGNTSAAVNIRCLENIDLDKIPVHNFDGRAA